MEPYPPKYETRAYIARHLQDAIPSAQTLMSKYGEDFNSFFYWPDLEERIKQEIIPFHIKCPKGECPLFKFDHWKQKHPFNFPGPFYSGYSDTCGTGDTEAPDNVLYDDCTQEYVFRQPANYLEFICVIDAAWVEVLDSYSCDGNVHWTYEKCKDWWKAKFDLVHKLQQPEIIKVNGLKRVSLYIDYLNTTAQTDLQRYCYFLENGSYPHYNALLPSI
jgi:hypothetical protein